MKNTFLILSIASQLFIGSFSDCLAQTENVQMAVFKEIKAAEMESSQIPDLAHHLTDVTGPRLTNSPGFVKASEWAVQKFKLWGLANVHLEPWGNFGKGWELHDFYIAMKLPYFQPVQALPAAWSGNTNGLQQAQVVLLTQAQSVDSVYIKKHFNDLKGKIVLILGEPIFTTGPDKASDKFAPRAFRFKDADLARINDYYNLTYDQIHGVYEQLRFAEKLDVLFSQAGVTAVINSESGNEYGTIFNEAFTGYESKSQLPKLKMAMEDCQRIRRLIMSGQRVELALNIKGEYSGNDSNAYNVVAEIPGADPKLKSESVIIGAHLDSWNAATGATDNASGCAVMMEAVRLLDSLKLRPKRTIKIILWSGEEQGLLGSYNYVKKHYIDPLTGEPNAEQAKVSGYFNLDNGTGKIRGIYAQGNAFVMPVFEKWFQPFRDLGANTVTIKKAGCTDHTSFDWAGIPAFEFIQDPIDYDTRTHHSNQDNYDHLEITDLKQAAVILAAFAFQAGNRNGLLPRKPFEKRKYEWEGMELYPR